MLRSLPLAMLLCLIASAANAHPHAWIDTSEEVLFDAAGRVTGIRQTWVFDEFYTAETVQISGKGGKAEALVAKLIHNLKEWGYFTRVQVDGKAVTLAEPKEKTGRVENGHLIMVFTTPLPEPLALKGGGLTYAVFDPTYYIEMLHVDRPDPVTLVGAPPTCRAQVVQSDPDPKAVAAAAALDRTQSGGVSLGANFAETVEVRCGGGE